MARKTNRAFPRKHTQLADAEDLDRRDGGPVDLEMDVDTTQRGPTLPVLIVGLL